MVRLIGHKKNKEMKKNKNWNPDEWQGRSRENVEASYRLAFYSMVGMVAILIIAAIIG